MTVLALAALWQSVAVPQVSAKARKSDGNYLGTGTPPTPVQPSVSRPAAITLDNIQANARAHCQRLFPESARMRQVCTQSSVNNALQFNRISTANRDESSQRSLAHCRDLAYDDDTGTVSYMIAVGCAKQEIAAVRAGF